MPRVELVQRHNFSARRLTIRGHNGKLYPYLVVNDAWLTESRREERVLQLLRMLNHFFDKRKETCRRGLQFTVPRVVAVSPQMRLIEVRNQIIYFLLISLVFYLFVNSNESLNRGKRICMKLRERKK